MHTYLSKRETQKILLNVNTVDPDGFCMRIAWANLASETFGNARNCTTDDLKDYICGTLE